jgi:hypothetical protein
MEHGKANGALIIDEVAPKCQLDLQIKKDPLDFGIGPTNLIDLNIIYHFKC